MHMSSSVLYHDLLHHRHLLGYRTCCIKIILLLFRPRYNLQSLDINSSMRLIFRKEETTIFQYELFESM